MSRIWSIREGYEPEYGRRGTMMGRRGDSREMREAYEEGYECGYAAAMEEAEGRMMSHKRGMVKGGGSNYDPMGEGGEYGERRGRY